MKYPIPGLLALACILALAAGCSPASRSPGCEDDADCPAGQACLEGECAPVDCRSDADCDAGQDCFDHTCVDQGTCISDGQCPTGSICIDHACLAGCRVDADCPSGSLCVAELGEHGQCVDCRSDGDCGAHQRCVGYTCRSECAGDGDCPGGHCDLLSSTCVECLQDAHCDPLEICLDDACQTGCRQDDACPQGQICSDQQCRAGCRDDGDCPQGQACDQSSWTCQAAGCESSADCEPGQVCIDQQCVPGCESNRDCPQGQVCDQAGGANGECVDCLADGDCPNGSTCQDRQCFPTTPVCDLGVEPSQPIELGTVPLGGLSAVSFTLESLGTGACTISQLELHQTGEADQPAFRLADAPALPLVLAPAGQPGDRAVVDVLFVPVRVGQQTATFWLSSDDPDLTLGQNLPACQLGGNWTLGEACVPISGSGGGNATCDGLTALPRAVLFGEVTTGCNSLERTVRIYDVGQVSQAIADLVLDPPDAPGFEIRSAPVVPFTLDPGQHAEVVLRFSASSPGVQAANLIARTAVSGCQLTVPLVAAGVEDSAAEDLFELPPSPRVDVLWVVDNSGSMQPIQEALAAAAAEYIQWAVNVGLDFHIGVVTTDMEDETQAGRLQGSPRFITPATPNPAAAFASNVQVGTYGSGTEMGLAASFAALSEPLRSGANAGFYRDDAELNVIYVSDEDDQSPMGTDFYTDFFVLLKGYLELIDVSAVVGDAPGGCESQDGIFAVAGTRYLDLVDTFWGMFQSVCGPDWNALWDHLGMADLEPQRSFALSRPAVEDTIEVFVNGQPVPPASGMFTADGFTFVPEFNALWLGDDVAPPFGAVVSIQYEADCP